MENKKNEQKEKRREEAQEIQKMECRMYENKFPNIDDLVMVRKIYLIFQKINIFNFSRVSV
jgi:hypothetical protein